MKIEIVERMENVHEHLSTVSRKNEKHVVFLSIILRLTLANFRASKLEEGSFGLPRIRSEN